MKLLIASCRNISGNLQVNNPGFVRVIVLYDAQANASAPTQAEVLQDPTNIMSLTNLDNRERFRIVADKLYYVGFSAWAASGQFGDTGTVTASDRQQSFCKKFKANMKLDTVTNGTSSGAIGDITSGSLYLLTGTSINNSIAAGTPSAVVNGYCRVRFYDA